MVIVLTGILLNRLTIPLIFCYFAELPFMLKLLSRLLWILVAIPVIALVFVVINYFLITISVRHLILEKNTAPESGSWILVPGAGNSEPGQWVNYTFENRMEAAKNLWSADSTSHFIVSGMIKPPYYDEPADMKERLIQYGIPETYITCDTNGTRTWNSVKNSGMIAKGRNLVIVSQQEHLERALFCAACQGIRSGGIAAEPPPYAHRYWTYREYLARVKATMDCVAFRFKNK
jgi:SanA protein